MAPSRPTVRKKPFTVYVHPEVAAYFKANLQGQSINQLMAYTLTIIANEGMLDEVLKRDDEEG